MPFSSEESLRGEAAMAFDSLVKKSRLFQGGPANMTPRFLPSECHPGAELGIGGFSIVYEIQSLDLKSSNQVSQSLEIDEEVQQEESEIRIYMSKNTMKDGNARYAIKTLKNATLKKANSPDEEVQSQFVAGVYDLAMEVKFLSFLSHPHIIKMRGMASLHPCSDSFFIILDRLYDTLQDRVKKWSKTQRKLSGPLVLILDKKGSKKERFFVERLCVAHEICSALNYLHLHRIVYRDLKPDNIGFDVRDEVKLFDFGLAREVNLGNANVTSETDENLYRMSEAGSLRWMAPEVAACKPYNRKVDVYSFGLMLWHICCLELPYKKYDIENFRENVFGRGVRPDVDKKLWPSHLSRLVERCWSTNISDRPDCSEILNVLRSEISGFDSSLAEELDISNQTQKSMEEQR